MKRIFSLILALSLLIVALPAHAEGADIRANLPQTIRAFFEKSQYAGNTLGSDAYVEITGTVAGDFAFAALTEGSAQTLYGFTRQNGGDWTYWLKTGNALPQRAGDVFLRCSYGDSYDVSGALLSEKPTLEIGLRLAGIEEYWSYSAAYELSGTGGQWMLISLISYLANGGYTNARVYSDRIRYMNDGGDTLATVYGTVQRNLRYHSFSAFPATPEIAREKLTQPPALPAGSELSSQNVHFTGGQTFPVYSGPGTNYYRAAGGNAKVSTNDWIQVFGRENGYVLIQYAISAGHMRFGYIQESALPKGAQVPALNFTGTAAYLQSNALLIDDPLGSQSSLRTLKSGSLVTRLASMGDWAYVEVSDGTPIRGFVKKNALSVSASGTYHSDEYTARATAQLGSACAVTVTVSGPAAWANDPDTAVTGYILYANNSPVANVSGPWQQGYTLTAVLPQHTSLLGLCPIRGGQPVAEETVIIPLP